MLEKIRQISIFRNISQGVWGVSIASMLIAISTTMTFSISPLYMTKVLGLSMLSLGLAEGICEGISQISRLLAGYTGDYFQRKKPPLLFGAFLATISKPIFILAGGLGAVVFSKALERVSNGVMATPRDAYIAEASEEQVKGKSFGLMMTLKTIGCTIGSFFIAALAGYYTDDYRTLLWFGFFPCLISLFVLFKYMPEKKTTHSDSPVEIARPSKSEKRIRWADFKQLSFRYWTLILVATLFMSARFADGFLILRLDQVGAPVWLSASTIGIFNIISSLCCLPIGHLSDRIDRSKMLYFSFITLVLTNVFMLMESLSVVLLGLVMWGAQRGTSQVLFSAIIADEAPRKIIGTAMGIFYLLTGITAVIAGSIAGSLSETSVRYAFYFGFGVSSLALIMLYIRNEMLDRQQMTVSTLATEAS
jgi:MFS family permease